MPGVRIGQILPMGLPGEMRVVEDVPTHFADLVVANAPRSIGLSGGDTARRCYERLAARPFDWSDIEVFFSDERFVPPEHAESNEGMARAVLLDAVHPKVIHSMYWPGPIEAAADAYHALVRDSPPIDLLHLGLGPDGHTASLFPGSPALAVDDRFVVATESAQHPHTRLTFTVPAIARSPLVVVTVSGAEKRDALARIRAGEDLPAARISAKRVLWLADEGAAG